MVAILWTEEESAATIATATTYEGIVSSSPAPEDTNASTTASFLSPNFSEELGNLSAGGEVPVFPGYIRITSMVFCFVILGIGVVGNVMVPIVILKTKDMRNSTNIFLMNLSVADLMVLLVCTPTVLVEVNSKPETWVLGEEMCKIVPFVELTVAHASVLTILAISFERYYAICEPLKASYVCTKARALLICLLAWLFAALFTSPILGVADYHHEIYLDGSIVAVCLTQAETFWKALFFIMSIAVFFAFPLVILVALYTIIARHLMTHPGIMAPASRNRDANGGLQHSVLRYRKQVVLMLGTVVLSFFVCLMPFRAFTLWIIVAPQEVVFSLSVETYYNFLYFCRVMTYLNSAINPILYNIMSSKFRDGFFRLCGFRRKPKHSITLDRKGTFNTTSSTTTTTTCSSNLQDSFWRRSLRTAICDDSKFRRSLSTNAGDSNGNNNANCKLLRTKSQVSCNLRENIVQVGAREKGLEESYV